MRSFTSAAGSCPWKEVPQAGADVVLVRCAGGSAIHYTLALPDTRLPEGIWTLTVDVKDRAAVPAAKVLPVLVEGVVDAFG